jgi:hypothetical protein
VKPSIAAEGFVDYWDTQELAELHPGLTPVNDSNQ